MSMIVESVFLLLCILSGYFFVALAGANVLWRIFLSLIIGFSIYLTVVYLQIMLGVSSSPIYSMAAVLLIVAALAYFCIKSCCITADDAWIISVLFCVIIIAVYFLNGLNLVKFHYDSLRYLIVGSIISSDNLNSMSANLLNKRLSSIAIINAPANLAGTLYFHAAIPLLAIFTVGTMFILVKEGLSKFLCGFAPAYFALMSAALLIANNRFVFHSFYINDHMLEAAFLLVVVGAGWLGALGVQPISVTSTLQAICIPGIVFSRQEGFIMAALALLPTLVAPKVEVRRRMLLFVVLGLSIMLQAAVIMRGYHAIGQSTPVFSFAMFLVGLCFALHAAGLRLQFINNLADQVSKYTLGFVEFFLWTILAGLAVWNWPMLETSVNATVDNVVLGSGGWGASVVILGVLVSAVLMLTNAPARAYIRFPLTSFIPAVFLLAYLREGPYRVGVTDSLSRMIIHVVPLAVLLVASAATSQAWGLDAWRKSHTRR